MVRPEPATNTVKLDRGIGLSQATAANLLAMIGVGPFLTLPSMVKGLGGPHIIYAWLVGAVLALCDGLVYAHLGAALPGSGGPLVYLREAFAPLGLGQHASFLFIFQTMVVAPLSIAAGAVGFVSYLGYFFTLPPPGDDVVAAALCLAMTALLYRPIRSVGKLSLWMLGLVVLTFGWIIIVGLFTFSPREAFAFPPEAFHVDMALIKNVGPIALLAMYNYGGYNTVCYLGEEVKAPERTIPRAILMSIVVVVLLYVVMSTVVLGTVPWREVANTDTVASLFIARTIGDPTWAHVAAVVMTGLILLVTAAALYALILGYSRVPFAAARDGQFFRWFARVHPTGHFPHRSLVVLGLASVPFCFLSFGRLVNWLLLVQILLQFVWQCAGVVLLQRYRKDIPQPFRMWLYPLPSLVALAMWIYVFVTSDLDGIMFAVCFLACALAAYAVFQRLASRAQAG
jgi:amino acid transporter